MKMTQAKSAASGPARIRVRTSFDPEYELPRLHQWFSENQHPSRLTLQVYAKELNSLPSRQSRKLLEVRNLCYWFKNARAAYKRAEIRVKRHNETQAYNLHCQLKLLALYVSIVQLNQQRQQQQQSGFESTTALPARQHDKNHERTDCNKNNFCVPEHEPADPIKTMQHITASEIGNNSRWRETINSWPALTEMQKFWSPEFVHQQIGELQKSAACQTTGWTSIFVPQGGPASGSPLFGQQKGRVEESPLSC